MCVITPAGWMNAGNADFLRERLAAELTLEELFLFGSYRLFAADQGPAPTPTVESAILVARKAPAPRRHTLRVVAVEDERAVTVRDRAELLAELARRASGRRGRRGGIHVHDVRQDALVARYPWPVKVGARDVAARVVAHLEHALASEPSVERLEVSWKAMQGIQTGADAYTARIDRRLTAEERRALGASGVAIGDPILELPTQLAALPPWRSHPEVLAKSPEARGLLYGAIDDDFGYLVVLRGDAEPPAAVLEALERFKPILATRAEIARNPRRSWWETAWPRGARDLRAPKVIALYRTDRGRFSLDESGEWSPSIKATFVVGRDEKAPVAYLCGLLNSELLDLWYGVRGKTPWHVRRNYEPLRMNELPYRRPDGDPRADEIAERVRRIAANRRALLPFRASARDLDRTVKDVWKSGPVEVDRPALVDELPRSSTVSVRLDPELIVEGRPSGAIRRPATEVLVARRGGQETGRVTGAPARLDLLEEMLAGSAGDDLGALLLPKDLVAFEAAAAARFEGVTRLLAEGRTVAEEVERFVCGLYGLPDELTEAVVEHAVARAANTSPG